MSLDVPPAPTTNPFARIREDWASELRATRGASLPPGGKLPSIARTERMRRDPLSVLLPAYEEHGPIFAIRIFHAIHVFMLGPEANRFILVTDRDQFRWRDGSLGDLIPLIGDGLLTTDGTYHDRAREIMVPVFHRERIAAAAAIMTEEANRALAGWRAGQRVDLYDWTRHVTMRVAMRALFGLDPDRAGIDVAATFERGLSFYEREYWLQVLRGPGSPFSRLRRVRETLDGIILGEIARRRRAGDAGEDILGLLIEAEDSEGERFTESRCATRSSRCCSRVTIRPHRRWPSSSTSSRATPSGRTAWRRSARRSRAGTPDAAQLFGEMPQLDMAVSETLRLYPPAWIGPRRGAEDSSSAATRSPPASPSTTRPGRATAFPTSSRTRTPSSPSDSPQRSGRSCRRARTCRSAAGRGSASGCVSASSRFGRSRQRSCGAFASSWSPDRRMRIRQMPTLSPRGGLPMRVVRPTRA